MKKSSDYVDKAVYKVNKNYSKLQNLTEELFFQCLDEGRSVEYFIKKLDDIWGKIDHSYLNEIIDEYINIIHQNNLEQLNIQTEKESGSKGLKISPELLLLIGLGFIFENEKKFTDYIKKKYKMYYDSPEYKKNKEEYLKRKVKDYDNQVIPYYDEYGNIVRYVQLSTYLAMKYNTTLTRAGWERTIQDGIELGYNKFWIPPHLFSCEHCVIYQGRLLSLEEVNSFMDHANEGSGDILHPNCKCTLLIYVPGTRLIEGIDTTQDINMNAINYYYDIRQKVNSLTLKKERLLTERKIYKRLGYQNEVDKLNNKIRVINSQIRDLINDLPTEEMKKKVVAINR